MAFAGSNRYDPLCNHPSSADDSTPTQKRTEKSGNTRPSSKSTGNGVGQQHATSHFAQSSSQTPAPSSTTTETPVSSSVQPWRKRPYALMRGVAAHSSETIDLIKIELNSSLEANDYVTIKDIHCVASYNWIHETDRKNATISIPGCPHRFITSNIDHYREWSREACKASEIENTAEGTFKFSFEPMFQAINLTKPDCDMRTISLVADEWALATLLHWILGYGSYIPDHQQQWRLDVQLIEDTIFFSRYISGDPVSDNRYAHRASSIPRFLTPNTPEVLECSSHFRTLSYTLGGLNCLVQFKAHACIDEQLPGVEKTHSPEALRQKPDHEASSHETTPSGITVIRDAHQFVHQSQIVELKVFNESSKLHLENDKHFAVAHWISQSENFQVARTRGQRAEKSVAFFEKLDISNIYHTWEQREQGKLRALMLLIRKIREAVENLHGRKGAIIFDASQGPTLGIYERSDNREVLPQDLKAKFWHKSTSSDTNASINLGAASNPDSPSESDSLIGANPEARTPNDSDTSSVLMTQINPDTPIDPGKISRTFLMLLIQFKIAGQWVIKIILGILVVAVIALKVMDMI